MKYVEVIAQVKHLSQAEKIALLKMLTNSLEEETPSLRRKRTLKTLYGALRPKDGAIPTDRETKEEYIDYLVKKYK